MPFVYSGDVVAQQIFDIDDYESRSNGAVLDAIMKNEKPSTSVRYPVSNLADEISASYTGNYAKKVNEYLNHARFHHSDNIPTNIAIDEYHTNNPDDENFIEPHPDIKVAIEAEIGEEIDIHWYMFGRPDKLLLMNHYFISPSQTRFVMFHRSLNLHRNLRFEDTTNGKSYLPSRISHLGNTLTVEANEIIYGLDPESGFYLWIPQTDIETFVFDLSITSGIIPTDRVHQVIYKTVSTDEANVWYYNESADPGGSQHPNIYGSVEFVNYENESYPFAMIIEEGKQVIKGHVGEQYKEETEDLLSKIDLDLETLMDSLSGEGPDAGDVNEDIKDAVVLYSVNFDSDNNGVLQYIYEHFRQYYVENATRMDNAHAHWLRNTNQPDWRNKFTSGGQMGFYNNRFQFMMRFRWMSMHIKEGLVDDPFPNRPNILDLGIVTYNADIDSDNTGNVTTGWPNGEPDPNVTPVKIGKITKHVFEGQEYAADTDHPQSINDHLYILRKQLTAGNDGTNGKPVEAPTYVEMTIMGLVHHSRLTNPDGYFSTNSGEVIHIITTIMQTEDGKFFMPLSVGVMDNFNSLIQSEIFYSSLTLALTLYNETKLPWYADSALMFAIRIVLVIATWGSSEIWMQGLWEIIKQVITHYVIQLLVMEAVTLLIDLVGGEVGLILAAIAVAVAAYAGSGGDGLNLLTDIINAEQLMQAATLLVDAVNTSISEDFLELQEQIEDEEALQEEREEELDSLVAQLGPTVTIDMVDVVVRQPTPDFYETPSDFYNRSVHITNPGVLSLDSIDSYVGNAISLPQFKT